ncbi:LPXTG cell wall anchor domain-containing protein, partial [Gardnerella vaginalis]|uniref:LPXTG cell wall anchor domain-containing protein n=1 Tax=Gardnerella vaginalis TaxID=2702 RepID=UPI0011C36A75
GKAIVKGIAVTGNTIVMVDKLSIQVLPKTGESSSLDAFLSALGLSLAGLGVFYKKKSMKDRE